MKNDDKKLPLVSRCGKHDHASVSVDKVLTPTPRCEQ
jgi:hypothetical protein